jgi:hypothetical protein
MRENLPSDLIECLKSLGPYWPGVVERQFRADLLVGNTLPWSRACWFASRVPEPWINDLGRSIEVLDWLDRLEHGDAAVYFAGLGERDVRELSSRGYRHILYPGALHAGTPNEFWPHAPVDAVIGELVSSLLKKEGTHFALELERFEHNVGLQCLARGEYTPIPLSMTFRLPESMRPKVVRNESLPLCDDLQYFRALTWTPQTIVSEPPPSDLTAWHRELVPQLMPEFSVDPKRSTSTAIVFTLSRDTAWTWAVCVDAKIGSFDAALKLVNNSANSKRSSRKGLTLPGCDALVPSQSAVLFLVHGSSARGVECYLRSLRDHWRMVMEFYDAALCDYFARRSESFSAWRPR